ncbi:sensor histidine kinase [Paenibacillus pasadenensis]|uniref:cache domain-containing sensor histidine kinase n=1 Tax=Paenibacillus pasadenensis TaxID=217090 RepID=UPI00203E994A|nr:sensor histidine kinase [Paenibacillus pasadenensis]MCM3747829.1 sensor histidine kinase [Paenibacillus pasadenensis]
MLKGLFIKRSSVQQKMLLSFLALVVLPLGLFSYISLTISRNTIEEQAGAAKLNSLRLISQKMGIMASDLNAISNLYFSNEELRSLLLSPSGDRAYQERLQRQFLTRLIVTYRYAYTWLEYYTSIFGFNNVELHTFYNGPNIGIENLWNDPWYLEAINQDGQIIWESNATPRLRPTIDEDHYVSAIRVLKDFESNTPVGMLMINVGESFLYKQYADGVAEDDQLIIFDKKGSVISATDKSRLGSSMLSTDYYSSITGNEGNFNVKLDGKPMLVTYYKVESTGWTLVSYTPLDTLLKEVNQSKWLTLIVLASLMLLSLLISYLIAKRLSVPIRRLYTSMKRVEMGDLSERTDIQGNDEIGELAFKFNRMVGRIEELHDRVVMEQDLKRKTELQNLQSQINTHFLYNTLASIRSMLVTEPAAKVDQVIVSLVKLLRKTLSDESEYITVAEELDNLQHYVTIQLARQYGKLNVDFNIQDGIGSYRTLKLLLQPIVENAIFHGIEPKSGPGTITVEGWQEEDIILLRITDDGVGIPVPLDFEEEIMLTDRVLTSAGGVGLRNVQRRMRAHFGERYGLEVVYTGNEGTCILLRWPCFIRVEELNKP